MANIEAPAPATSVESYLDRFDPELAHVADGLRRLMKKTLPKVIETVNPWGIPCYEVNGPMCYFMICKKHITFGFAQGGSLPDPHHLLGGTGKYLRHVKLRTPADLKKEGLPELIRAAAAQNMAAPTNKRMARKKKTAKQ